MSRHLTAARNRQCTSILLPLRLATLTCATATLTTSTPSSSHGTYAQRRAFTQSSRLAGYRKMTKGHMDLIENRNGAMTRRIQRALDQEPAQKSTKAIMKEIGMAGKIPTDLGLLPGTLVMPARSDRPSIFSQPKSFFLVQTARIWKRIKDQGSMLIYKFYNGRPYIKLANGKVPGIAKAMHSKMYAAFAEANEPALRDILCRGLFTHYASRLASRPRNISYVWTLHRHVGRPRIVSQRATFLPLPEAGGRTPAMRQAVVRIRSVQSVKAVQQVTSAETGETAWEDVDDAVANGQQKEIDEYVVMQQRIMKGKLEDWKIWGTLQPTPWDDIQRIVKQNTPGQIDEPADESGSRGGVNVAAA